MRPSDITDRVLTDPSLEPWSERGAALMGLAGAFGCLLSPEELRGQMSDTQAVQVRKVLVSMLAAFDAEKRNPNRSGKSRLCKGASLSVVRGGK